MVALPNEPKLSQWQQILAERGILETALECGWTLQEIRGVAGWVYPLQQFSGAKFSGVSRWKAIDRASAPMAYQWLGTKPDACEYYWASGVKEAIEDSWGVLYITAGEPDMLSMIAAGRRNVTSFFGEGNIPETLLLILQKIKVSQVIYLADMDNVGIDAAVKLINALQSVIKCEVKRLPCKDVNDLWIEHGFNSETFLAAIDNAPVWAFGAPQDDTALKPFYNYAAYAETVENALHLPEQKRNGWSKPIPCIFANHSNDDKQPSMGWNYKTHQCRCFKCGETWGCDDVAARLGIDLEQFNENAGKTRADFKILPAAQGKQPQAAAPALNTVIRTSDESLERYIERLDGKHIAEVTAASFPFTVLHHLGGFCEILKPRKMVGVIGLSGGGKTSFLESAVDVLRQEAEFHTLWWGKEWRWDEMSDRAVQRQGGMTITEIGIYETYQSMCQKHGKTKHEAALPKAKLDKIRAIEGKVELSKELARKMLEWAGKVFYYDKPMHLESTLEFGQRYLDEKKSAGYPVRVGVWDYASLFEVRGSRSELEKISNGLAMVKDFGETNDLFSFVATQPRKDDAEQVKAGEKILSAEDALYANDHKFNLMLTLNPMYVDNVMQNWGLINVVKNSGGKLGKVAVKMDLPRLRWLDEPVSDGWGE